MYPSDADDVPWIYETCALPQPTCDLSLGERKLFAAILHSAILDAKYAPKDDRAGARAWLANVGPTAEEVCDALGIDYGAMMTRCKAEWALIDVARATKRNGKPLDS